MGFIRSVREPRRWGVLKHDFLIGREEGCDLVLARPGVSKRHASVRWDGQQWMLRDLLSRNGTFVQARAAHGPERVPADRGVPLALGDRLMFAEADEEWSVVDVAEPRSLLVEVDREPDSIILLDPTGVVAVPSEERLRVTMHRDRVSGEWLLEEPGADPRVLRDGEVIHVDGRSYRLYIAESSDTVEAERCPLGRSLGEMQLELHPSPDEETAALAFRSERTELVCEQRAHLYLLVHLARCRLADAKQGKNEESCGWLSTDEVLAALGYRSTDHLAVDVFRCRKAVKELNIGNAAEIIERGRRGLLRIGVESAKLLVA